MKSVKRSLSILLALTICLTTFAPSAFADTQRTFKVVAVGDSTSNGCGLDDYGVHRNRTYVTTPEDTDPNYDLRNLGFLDDYSSYAYPVRLANYIGSKHPEYDVSFTNLAISGIRSVEIHALLDSSYKGDSYTQPYMNNTIAGLERVYDVADMSKFFIKQVKGADLITFDGVMNCFTIYFFERVKASVQGNDSAYAADTMAALMSSVSPAIKAIISPMEATVKTALSSLFSGSIPTDLMDTVLYCYTLCLVSFSETIQCIRKLNPKAQLIVGGTFNPFYGQVITWNGIEVDLGGLMGMVMNSVNTYITALDPNHNNYSFIQTSDHVETSREVLASYDDISDLPVVLRNHLIDDLFDPGHVISQWLIDDALEKAAQDASITGQYDLEDYRTLYAQDIADIFDRVAGGTEIDPVEQMLYDSFYHYLSYYLAGAKNTKLDLEGLLAATEAEFGYGELFELRNIPIDELTKAQKTGISFFVTMGVLKTACAHPSENGCTAKYKAAVKAYQAAKPACVSSAATVQNLVNNGVSVCKTSAKSILKLLKK